MASDFISVFRDALLDFLAPLDEAANNPAVLQAWLAQLGHTAAISGAPELSEIFAHAGALRATLAGLNPSSLQTLAGLQSLLQSGRDVSALVQELREFGNDPARANVAAELGEKVMALLLASYLRRNEMPLFRAASVFTLIASAETSLPAPAIVVDGAVVRNSASYDKFNFSAVSALFSDPGHTLGEYYFPNNLAQGQDAWLAAARLFGNLGYFANALGVSWSTSYVPSAPSVPDSDTVGDGTIDGGIAEVGDPPQDTDIADGTDEGAPDDSVDTSTDAGSVQDASGTDSTGDGGIAVVPDPLPDSYFSSYFPGFRLVLLKSTTAPGSEVALELQCSSSSHPGATPGYILSLVGSLDTVTTFDSWRLTLTANGQVPACVLNPSGFALVPDAVPLTGGTAKILLERLPAAGSTGPAFVFGSTGGTRLEIGSASLQADFSFDPAHIAAAISAKAAKGSFVIHSGDGDGFLGSVLPANGLSADFDFGLIYSSDGGLSFQGAAGLDATLPVGVSIGGVVNIPSLHLALTAGSSGLAAEVSASIGLSIGPIEASVDRMGFITTVTFPADGGSFGPLDLAFDFKPPSGVGLAIDSAGVSGGGFLAHDDAKHEYSGVLQLQFDDLMLQAFGLITTQVAGGEGYSLLALIDADFPPVQLGWGFSLDGVGGLLGVHRTASVDALRAAMKAGQLSTIMFPTSAITNAPLVLAQLDTLFPTAPGRFLFGPMALIGWGTPMLITASVAVILELPEPIKIILLGVIQAKLPTPTDPLVHLTMDALGVLDLSQDEFSLDATLYDSKLITYAISGDMALRANWGSQSEFLLAVGGFHPSFTPPPDFPALKRMAIDMSTGSVTKLRLAAYLAMTSNSVQFGAQLDVFIGASGYGLSGHLGFDALLQLQPFHFEADISGSIALTAGGDELMSVSLDAALTGPAPWNIAGKFKIHIVFFDVHVSFSQSWGLDAPSQQTPAVDVGALLGTALADPRNWNSRMPAGLSALVSTRQVEDPTAVFAHPLAQLGVQERIVPLELAITRFGEAALAGANEFAITDFRIGTGAPGYTAVQDSFAPAQFFDLSDTDKLSRPSFELHDSGVLMSGGLVTIGSSLPKTIDYETFFIDTPGAIRVDEGVPQPFPWTVIEAVLLTGPAARKTISRAGNRRYTAPGNPITVAEPAFVLVDTTALTPQGAPSPGKTTYSDVHAMLTGALAASPDKRGSLQIIATHELVAA